MTVLLLERPPISVRADMIRAPLRSARAEAGHYRGAGRGCAFGKPAAAGCVQQKTLVRLTFGRPAWALIDAVWSAFNGVINLT